MQVVINHSPPPSLISSARERERRLRRAADFTRAVELEVANEFMIVSSTPCSENEPAACDCDIEDGHGDEREYRNLVELMAEPVRAAVGVLEATYRAKTVFIRRVHTVSPSIEPPFIKRGVTFD
jgi:hypothetical protein